MTKRYTVVREGRAVTRKPHVIVPQERYLEYLRTDGPHTLREMIEHFDVSRGTATRKLNGLLHQGLVRRELAPLAVDDRFEAVS